MRRPPVAGGQATKFLLLRLISISFLFIRKETRTFIPLFSYGNTEVLKEPKARGMLQKHAIMDKNSDGQRKEQIERYRINTIIFQIGVRERLRVRVLSSEHAHFDIFRLPNLACSVRKTRTRSRPPTAI